MSKKTKMCVGITESGYLCRARGSHGPLGDLCKRHHTKYQLGVDLERFYEILGQHRRHGSKGMHLTRFKMACDNNRKMRELGKKIMGARILATWRRAISNPSYKMCRDRLMREFSEFCEQG